MNDCPLTGDERGTLKKIADLAQREPADIAEWTIQQQYGSARSGKARQGLVRVDQRSQRVTASQFCDHNTPVWADDE